MFANKDTTACTVTLYLVPSAGTAGQTNILIATKSMPTDGSPLLYPFRYLYMNAGDTVQALASVGTQVTLHLSGEELS